MTGGPDRHRRSLRLKDYDYARAGAYFVTICAQDRACLFGDIVDGEMRLNDAGRMVVAVWDALPDRFQGIGLDAFVLMPNHIHGIIVLVGAGLVPARDGAGQIGDDPIRATTRVAPTALARRFLQVPDGDPTRATTRVAPTVGGVVGALKSITTVLYTRGVNQSGWPAFRGRVWQRNYYEHVIRDETSLHGIREYVLNNPLQWALDRENPANVGAGLVPALDAPTTGDRAGTRPAPTGAADGSRADTRPAPTAWGEV